MAAWSTRVNLTGARTAEERVAVLVSPVVSLAAHLRPGRLIDIGSGSGSPGIVLAALRPDLAVTLLEPRQRRWAFLRQAARAIGRPEIDVRRERLQAHQGRAENVTIRALSVGGEAAVRLTTPTGIVWAFGDAVVPDEAVRPGPAAPPGIRAWVSRETRQA